MHSLNHSQSKITLVLLASLLVFPMAVTAQNAEQSQPTEEVVPEVQSGTSITVYVDAKFGKRRKGAAKSLTKSHEKYLQLGYRFEDLELYAENGDLEGFFVTYTKN